MTRDTTEGKTDLASSRAVWAAAGGGATRGRRSRRGKSREHRASGRIGLLSRSAPGRLGDAARVAPPGAEGNPCRPRRSNPAPSGICPEEEPRIERDHLGEDRKSTRLN